MAFVLGLLLLVVGATVAAVASAQFLALEQHRLPGAPSAWWSMMWYGHMEPRDFDPAVREQVRKMRRLAAVGVSAVVVGLVLVAVA